MKYIVVTGGVISGIGKGITASCIGLLLKRSGVHVSMIKIDPYLNIDAGTMSPYEHGECFVLSDGSEVDLDLGNYERFLDIQLTNKHNITTGKIFREVLFKERRGDYLGKTVQIVPHVTDEIQEWIRSTAFIAVDEDDNTPEVCIIEVGGTIGDMENVYFIEAIRQFSMTEDVCFVHVCMVIDNGEIKTKPVQHSVSKLRSMGISPDMLFIRTKDMLSDHLIIKLSKFCGVKRIISNVDVACIEAIPQNFKRQGVHRMIANILNLPPFKVECDLSLYNRQINKSISMEVVIYVVGKYTDCPDTYLSLDRAIKHACNANNVHPVVIWSGHEPPQFDLDQVNAIIIPGGFGDRYIDKKLKIAKYARENRIPILGICLGLQIMVTDIWRSAGYEGGSLEWGSYDHPIIDLLPGQDGSKGGTMRRGDYTTELKQNSLAHNLYCKDTIVERHRHRYEVNNDYVEDLEKLGLKFVGKSKAPDGYLMEIAELDNERHPFYVGCQYHPEYKSTYTKPHPLFLGLVSAAIGTKTT